MDYLSSILSSLVSTIFIIFGIAALGYLIGGIEIKKVSLGTAGVLIVALVFGIVASFIPYINIGNKTIVLYLTNNVTLEDGILLSSTKPLFSLVSNIGTAMFVTAVGLIAGPKFFRAFNRRFIGYVAMGVVIIIIGSLSAIVIMLISNDPELDASMVSGLLSGALTSTPGLSSAVEVAVDDTKVTAGYGISYIFGVIGVVLFVQLMPRFLHIDIKKERQSFCAANTVEVPSPKVSLHKIDAYGFFPFVLTISLGCIIGCIKIPGINFSFGTSGGVLIAGLVLGHFGHIGKIDCRIDKSTLNFFRELGLCLFLIGAGVPGGVNFISNVKLSYFIYGIILTIVPMILGFLIGKYIFKFSIFNNLGSITGGMTSTPALGSLIATAGTDEVSAAYAATYPIALVCIVIATKLLALL